MGGLARRNPTKILRSRASFRGYESLGERSLRMTACFWWEKVGLRTTACFWWEKAGLATPSQEIDTITRSRIGDDPGDFEAVGHVIQRVIVECD
jgi:hypothetical protein